MAHVMSPAETELAKSICDIAGIEFRRVQRIEILMEAACPTILRLTVLALDNEVSVKAMQTQLHEFKLVPRRHR